MKKILSQVANQYHVSENEVRNEIHAAICTAMQSSDPEAQAFWSQFHGEPPTPEEIIERLCVMIATPSSSVSPFPDTQNGH